MYKDIRNGHRYITLKAKTVSQISKETTLAHY